MSIWNTALNLLARREYSQYELRNKLATKFPDSASEIAEVLDRLVEQGLQSDQRFVEMWLRSQIEKGRGPVRISYESRQKGIQHLIEGAIQQSSIDWFELAENVLKRRFSSVVDQKERARAFRYLSYRGFSSEMISHAMDALSADKA